MKKIFLNLAAVVLLSTSCSKYNNGKIEYIDPPVSPPEEVPHPVIPDELTGIKKINELKDLQNINILSKKNEDLALAYWDEPSDLKDSYYKVHVTTLNSYDKLEYVNKKYLTLHKNKISFKKELIGEGLDVVLFLEKDDEFLYKGEISLSLGDEQLDISSLSPQGFWDNPIHETNSLGNYPAKDNLGLSQESGMSYSEDGTELYIADTNNNRVMIYANVDALRCKEKFKESKDILDLCLLSSKYSPMVPYGVIGQVDFYSNNTNCNNGYDECLRRPSGVLYHNKKLYISDGYNRVVIMDNPSVYGCHNIDSFLGKETPVSCAFDRIIGKESLDTSNKWLNDMSATLSGPTGLAMHKGNLYIADTDNYRVVIAKDVDDASKWNCTPENFGQEGCVFSAVLGQRDLQSYDDFWNYIGSDSNSEIYIDYTNKTVVDENNHMKRFISYPMSIAITEEGYLMVATDDQLWESYVDNVQGKEVVAEVYSRVLIFKNLPKDEKGAPTCDPTSFENGDCDADIALGQPGMNKVYTTDLDLNTWEEVSELTTSDTAIIRTSSISIIGKNIIVTDMENNKVNIWLDYTKLDKDNVTPDLRTTLDNNETAIGEINATAVSSHRNSIQIHSEGALREISLKKDDK